MYIAILVSFWQVYHISDRYFFLPWEKSEWVVTGFLDVLPRLCPSTKPLWVAGHLQRSQGWASGDSKVETGFLESVYFHPHPVFFFLPSPLGFYSTSNRSCGCWDSLDLWVANTNSSLSAETSVGFCDVKGAGSLWRCLMGWEQWPSAKDAGASSLKRWRWRWSLLWWMTKCY